MGGDGLVSLGEKVFLGYVIWTIIVFFVTRWFWLWYFKINKRTELLENIEQHLHDLKLLAQGKKLEDDNE